MRDWRRWISSGRRLSRQRVLSRNQPGAAGGTDRFADELQAEAGHLEAQYQQEKALRSRL